jgi:hypothetical protein
MNAEVNTQQCQCELCKPNWHLGDNGDTFEPQPVEQVVWPVPLENVHARKVVQQEFAEATG